MFKKKHLVRALLGMAALVPLLVLSHASPVQAEAANVGWINSRNIVSSEGVTFTSGAWLRSASNGRTYMVTNAHPFRDCQSCPVKPTSVKFYFEGSTSNWFTTANVIFPTNPSKAYYDIALVDFNLQGFTVAETRRGHYYCTATNCTSYAGGGSAANPNWAGSSTDVVAANSGQEGWGVIINKAQSGTSWGTISNAYHKQQAGWDYWGILVTGVSHCGMTHGDSGAPVFTGPTNQQLVFLGVLASFGSSWWNVTNNPCYSGTRTVSNSLVYIDWYDIQQAWSGLNLQPITYV